MIISRKSVSFKNKVASACLVIAGATGLLLVRLGWIAGWTRVAGAFLLVGLSLTLAAISLQKASRAARRKRLLIVGTGARAGVAWRELRTKQWKSVEVVGFIDDREPEFIAPDIAHRLIGRVDEMPAYLLQHVVDEIVIAAPIRSCYDMVERVAAVAEVAGIKVSYMCDALPGTEALSNPGKLFINRRRRPHGRLRSDVAKRALDLVVASSVLTAFAPLFLIIAVLVKLTSDGPVFFIQERVGLRRRTFPMVKFRSMVKNAEALMPGLEEQNQAAGPLFKVEADPRVTALGRVLRATSLDELPQLFNVLAGQMSLVGPRPMSLRDLGHVADAVILRRFAVKPGMTGLWQLRRRSSVSFVQWSALDVHYVDRWSVGMDVAILARTLPAILRRTDA